MYYYTHKIYIFIKLSNLFNTLIKSFKYNQRFSRHIVRIDFFFNLILQITLSSFLVTWINKRLDHSAILWSTFERYDKNVYLRLLFIFFIFFYRVNGLLIILLACFVRKYCIFLSIPLYIFFFFLKSFYSLYLYILYIYIYIL